MGKGKNITNRLLAALLSACIVFSMLPFQVFAATTAHSEWGVTITVTDEKNNPISGAEVSYTIRSESAAFDGLDTESGKATTDETGSVEILQREKFVPNDLTVSATVSKEGYTYAQGSGAIVDSQINDAGQDFVIQLRSNKIKGIEITFNTDLKYQDGKALPLLDSIEGTQDDDVVIIRVDGDDEIQYTVGKDEEVFPEKSEIGTYQVTVIVQRDGYEDYTVSDSVKIGSGELSIDGLNITPNDLTYNREEQAALTVQGQGNYTLQYTFDEANPWTTLTEDTYPKVKDAGEYTVYVRATKEGYTDAKYETYPIKVTVKKAPQTLEFVNEVPDEIMLKEDEENNIYDFSARGENLSGEEIKYSLIDSIPEDVATIDSEGKFQALKPGVTTVKVLRPGTDNYEDAELYATVTVKAPAEGLVRFEHDVVNYYLIDSENASEEKAIKTYQDDNGKLRYSIIPEDNTGLEIDPDTGVVTVNNMRTLQSNVSENNGIFSVTVQVDKSKGTVEAKFWENTIIGQLLNWIFGTEEITVYEADKATYTLNISYGETLTFEEACIISEKPDTGWYNNENPPEIRGKNTTGISDRPVHYTVSLNKDDKFDKYHESVTITDDGTEPRYIYVFNEISRRYCAPLEIDIPVDLTPPDANTMKISYDESVGSKLVQWVESGLGLKLGFFNPTVTVIFEASDALSGLDYLDWTYHRQEGASKNNLENETGRLEFDENGKAELVLTAEEAKQYRGHLSFTATDIAGNTSESKTDTGHVIILDTIAPECVVSYMDPVKTVEETVDEESVKRHYFSDKVELTVTVTENNFEEEDFKLMVSKDGEEEKAVELSWEYPDTDDSNAADNVFIGKYTLEEDGEYYFTANYTDRSGNQSEPYSSDLLIVDTTVPVLDVSPSQDDRQEITFTIVERNFDPMGFETLVTAVDLDGNSVEPNDLTRELQTAQWTPVEGKEYTYTYTTANYKDGIYDLKVMFTDPSNNSAVYPEEETDTVKFIIDHSEPSDLEISYSESIVDIILDNLTLGFYNPTVTVTFKAVDPYSGVDHFTWFYQKESDASEINVASYENKELLKEQIKQNGSVFTASVELPLEEAEQLRGQISVTATDVFDNSSDKLTDTGTTIVVDTVSPQMTVEYKEESHVQDYQTAAESLYYGIDRNATATLTMNVTEANFFADGVLISVDKEGEPTLQPSPVWTDTSVDDHTGVFSLTGDGHYVVSINYADKSTNQMNGTGTFQSKYITLDSIKPVIDVIYQNTQPVNVLADREGNQRYYYDRTQTAVITITEHNFDESLVHFDIVGTDVTGAALNIDQLIKKSEWTHNGDVHKITITYSGDANYTFDVDCTDQANNKSDDYTPDYFTVDTVAPVVTSVSYSPSVLETVLAGISFGFYNARATVTISANDDTAGVHKFDYSYLTAAGVSAVNAQLLNQAIEEAQIKYSNNGRTATITFDIPAAALGSGTQFNGTIAFDAIDRSDNMVERDETKRLVVDNIAPTANVTLNAPVNVANGVQYYDGSISGTVTITEANFYPEDVTVLVSRDGGAAQTLPTNWSNSSVDVHSGTFSLTDDGDYVITISYKDKSGNVMANYTSEKLTIDTKISAPTISINNIPKSGDNGGAYNNSINVSFKFEDQNLDAYKIKLTRTRFDKTEDVTDKYIKTTSSGVGGSGTFSIPKTVENDGIYLLTISMSDKAKHSVESHVRFTANRFGSVYSYDDYLCSLIKDGGQYIKLNGDAAITQDLCITEYNADQIVGDSLRILITKNGEPIKAQYSSERDASSDWYKYVYRISKDNFKEDGVYKITISSEDATGNVSTSVPENSMDSKGGRILDVMTFTVDTMAPEIRNVINLENAIADLNAIVDGKLAVKYTIVDVGGLAKAEIYLNDKLIDTIENFDNMNSYSGTFFISESDEIQKVRLVVTDLAGNITDTAADDFDPGDLYSFNDMVTVSTDFLVRWYRNTPAFWGTIGGVGGVGLLSALLLSRKRKKKAAV